MRRAESSSMILLVPHLSRSIRSVHRLESPANKGILAMGGVLTATTADPTIYEARQ